MVRPRRPSLAAAPPPAPSVGREALVARSTVGTGRRPRPPRAAASWSRSCRSRGLDRARRAPMRPSPSTSRGADAGPSTSSFHVEPPPSTADGAFRARPPAKVEPSGTGPRGTPRSSGRRGNVEGRRDGSARRPSPPGSANGARSTCRRAPITAPARAEPGRTSDVHLYASRRGRTRRGRAPRCGLRRSEPRPSGARSLALPRASGRSAGPRCSRRPSPSTAVIRASAPGSSGISTCQTATPERTGRLRREAEPGLLGGVERRLDRRPLPSRGCGRASSRGAADEQLDRGGDLVAVRHQDVAPQRRVATPRGG